MAGNPQVPQGTLNRIRASIVVPDFPELNVTSAFLGRAGVGIVFEGETTTIIPTMAGTVTSPQPYQMVTVTINLLRSQSLAATWEAQREDLSTIGDITVKPDTTTLPDYVVRNAAIETVETLNFAGEDASYVVRVKGYYETNNSLWSLA